MKTTHFRRPRLTKYLQATLFELASDLPTYPSKHLTLALHLQRQGFLFSCVECESGHQPGRTAVSR
jgi:hypothetical protein